MKLKKLGQSTSFPGIVRHGISGKPVLAQPDIEQKNQHKAGQIKNILLDRNRMAERRCLYAQRGLGIRKVEEPLRKDDVEEPSNGNKNGDGPPESALRDIQTFARQKPHANGENR